MSDTERKLNPLAVERYAQALAQGQWTVPDGGLLIIQAPMGSGKTQAYLQVLAERLARESDAADRLRTAGARLRESTSPEERRAAAREFLDALANLIARLLHFLLRALLLLLSHLLSRSGTEGVPVWNPEPIEASPQIAPRGPNAAFPVTTYRGGHHRSALGSAVLAA